MKIQDPTTRTAAELGVTGPRAGRTEADGQPTQPENASTAVAAGAGPAAMVTLSTRSRELHGALEAAKAAPDVRDEKVTEARRKLESGTYVIDPTRIARGILDSQG